MLTVPSDTGSRARSRGGAGRLTGVARFVQGGGDQRQRLVVPVPLGRSAWMLGHAHLLRPCERLTGTHRKGVRVRLVAVHGDGGRVVEGVEHVHSERVPVDLRMLLRHPDLAAHTRVASLEPEEEEEV